MAADPYANVNGLNDAGQTLTAITPSDSADIGTVYKALLIGATGGNIKFDAVNGATGVVIPVAAGAVFFAVRVKRLYSTGTTATPVYGIS